MRFISHRGNTNGKDVNYENTMSQICWAVFNGFEVEVDLQWNENDGLFLGHDDGVVSQKIMNPKKFLENKNLLVHCKNADAIAFIAKNDIFCEWFWHETDNYTLTNFRDIVSYPGIHLDVYSQCHNILMCPERAVVGGKVTKESMKATLEELCPKMFDEDLSHLFGICSDYIELCREIMDEV